MDSFPVQGTQGPDTVGYQEAIGKHCYAYGIFPEQGGQQFRKAGGQQGFPTRKADQAATKAAGFPDQGPDWFGFKGAAWRLMGFKQAMTAVQVAGIDHMNPQF